MPRAFIALDIPEATKSAIGAVVDTLMPQVRGIRWLSRETIHLTLRFLGDASEEALACLQPKLAEVAARGTPTAMNVSGLGLFPDRGSPRVLWLGAALPPELVRLQGDVEDAAAACGFAREDKPFRSHITLGRWRDRAARPTLPDADVGNVPVSAFVLYESRLHPRGAIHTPRARFDLGPAR